MITFFACTIRQPKDMEDPQDPSKYCSECHNYTSPLALIGRTRCGFGKYKCIWCINDIPAWKRYKRRPEPHYSSVHDYRVQKPYLYSTDENQEYCKITQFM